MDVLLHELAARDVRIAIVGDRLQLDAPRGALDDALRAALVEHKPALIRRLQWPDSVPLEPLAPGEPRILASFAQQRLWFLDRLGQGGGYHIPVAFELEGVLVLAALRAAIDLVVARHGALRTCLADPEGADDEPYQVVQPPQALAMPCVDSTAWPAAERQARVAELVREVCWSPFSLQSGPLLRASLIQLADARHLLVLCFHHIAFDGWSLGIFLSELSRAYAAALAGREPELAPLAVQYVDFAQWQRRSLVGERLKQHVDHWREHLRGAPPLLELPTDRPRPAHKGSAGARVLRVIDERTTVALEALSRQQRVTANTTLLAAFAVLLARYTGSDDLVIGTPVAHRSDARLEGLIGLFANTLAIRIRPAIERPFVVLLAEVQRLMGTAQAHQEVPFERIVEALGVERSLDRNPLFQVMFAFKDDQIDALELPGLRATPVEVEHEQSAFDLTLNLRRHSDRLLAIFEYDVALFDRSTIERLAESYATLLAGVIAGPDTSLGDLPLLAPGQRAAIVLGDASTTEPAAGAEPGVLQQLQRQAEMRPHAVALVCDGRELRYGELLARANTLAHHLRALGVGPEVRVGICLPRSLDVVVAIVAVLTAGGAYVPLDPSHPETRLRSMLEDAEVPVLLTRSDRGWQPTGVVRVYLDGLDDRLAQWPTTPPTPLGGPDALAYVIYTSGSTGRPKGVGVPHRALANLCAAIERMLRHGPDDVWLAVTTPAFDISVFELLGTLAVGAKVVIASEAAVHDGPALLELLERERVTSMQATPSHWRLLLDNGWAGEPALRAISTGEALPLALARQLAACTRELWNLYGPTEVTIWATGTRVPANATHIDIGTPLAGLRAYVLDARMRPQPLGVPGELWLAGVGVARGYLGRPALTAERFVPDPFGPPGDRMYRTGDRGRVHPDGRIELFGRLDHQVKLRGFRIEPGEIEGALLEHPAVREAVVMMRSEAGHASLVAWLVLGEPVHDLAATLREHLGHMLPSYMLPSAFVALAALPRSTNGKLDRQALPDPGHARASHFVPPRDGVELALVLVWERLLERAPIGVDEDFFALGGDSLLSVRLVSILERELGVRVPLHTIFQSGTIERLASVLRRELVSTPWSPLVCMQPAGERSPLFFVHAAGGIVFRYIQTAALLGKERPFYALQARGIEPGDAPFSSIEEMAAAYVRVIREVQPHGPYLVGGWSLGGSVAFEMARILEAQGESVPLLIMVDAPSPCFDSYEEDDVDFLLERLRPATGLELPALGSREARLHYLFEQQRLAGLLVPDVSDADAERRLALHKHHNRILCDYRPAGPCSTKIVFFEASESIPFDHRMKHPVPAWRELALDGLEVHPASGNHFNMFSAEHGPGLAAKLRARIAGLA